MSFRSLAIAALCFVPLTALAAEPNLQPGEWEFTATTTFPGTPMPEQKETTLECVTAEELKDGLTFEVDVEDCDVTEMDIREDGMNYAMTCQHEEGMVMVMDAEMRFLGDRTEGTMNANMTTPMGPMQMHIQMDGRRIGDC
jgi:hypothetical protein